MGAVKGWWDIALGRRGLEMQLKALSRLTGLYGNDFKAQADAANALKC